MYSFPRVMLAAGCALWLVACAGRGDAGDSGTGGAAGSAAGSSAGAGGTTGGSGSAGGTTGGSGSAGGSGGASNGRGGAGMGGSAAGNTGTAGTGGRGGGSAGASGGGGAAAAVWDCLDVPGTLCVCYARASAEVPACSAGYRCCFRLNATSCQCFVADEDCTSAASQYTQVATCPPA